MLMPALWLVQCPYKKLEIKWTYISTNIRCPLPSAIGASSFNPIASQPLRPEERKIKIATYKQKLDILKGAIKSILSV